MKLAWFFAVGLLVGTVFFPAMEARAEVFKPEPSPSRHQPPDGKEETALDSDDTEEKAHQARVQRLKELADQAAAEPPETVEEPAGAERPGPAAAPEGKSTDVNERLIESIEQLQMEIQELRKSIERAQVPEGEQAPMRPEFHRWKFAPET